MYILEQYGAKTCFVVLIVIIVIVVIIVLVTRRNRPAVDSSPPDYSTVSDATAPPTLRGVLKAPSNPSYMEPIDNPSVEPSGHSSESSDSTERTSTMSNPSDLTTDSAMMTETTAYSSVVEELEVELPVAEELLEESEEYIIYYEEEYVEPTPPPSVVETIPPPSTDREVISRETEDEEDTLAIDVPADISSAAKDVVASPLFDSLPAEYKEQLRLLAEKPITAVFIDPNAAYRLITTPVSLANYGSRKRISRGEAICKRALEEMFAVPFHSTRPSWLMNPETGYNLEIDCYNPTLKLGVEYNGIQHYEFTRHFHSSPDKFIEQLRRDQFKKAVCAQRGIWLIEVSHKVDFADIPRNIRERLHSRFHSALVR